MASCGYCPHCSGKVIESRVLNVFDDFTIKCPVCKKLIISHDIKFKRVKRSDLKTVDKK